jgi:DNA helicase-2/ATP-dependent DNA helicase PcrA
MEREGLEEERRLMYVAVTRARKRLYLSWAQTRMLHGQTRYCLASSFFDEIPDELLRRINPVSVAKSSYEAPAASAGWRKPAAVAESAALPNGLRIGMNVQHAKFGTGVIVSAEGRGSEARVQVNFMGAGMKWLLLEYAKLTPA